MRVKDVNDCKRHRLQIVRLVQSWDYPCSGHLSQHSFLYFHCRKAMGKAVIESCKAILIVVLNKKISTFMLSICFQNIYNLFAFFFGEITILYTIFWSFTCIIFGDSHVVPLIS